MCVHVYKQVKNVKYTTVTSPQTKHFHSKSTLISPTKLSQRKKERKWNHSIVSASLQPHEL